jgi:hypothetical protein
VLIARWDLDKTYLRTDFDTLRDLLRTAVERPDQKRTVPGAAELMRELDDHDWEVHILSGSPRQLRSRIVAKLRLDGVRFATLTLKPNVSNILRLRLRAVRGQLGYKLVALLERRSELLSQNTSEGHLIPEVLFGDDAEADAFVYSLFADICEGLVQADEVRAVMLRARAYEDEIERALEAMRLLQTGPVVRRILIHLERQSAPGRFEHLGQRVVPFYNYLQAACVLYEDGLLPPESLLRVAQALASRHHFDGGALARSYLEVARRARLAGNGLERLFACHDGWVQGRVGGAAASELAAMIEELRLQAPELVEPRQRAQPRLNYLELVASHNRRRHRHRA